MHTRARAHTHTHTYILKVLAHRSKEMVKSQAIRLFRGTGVTRTNQSLLTILFH